MSDPRVSLHLLVRPNPGAQSPLRLMVQSACQARPFLPHIGEVWDRLVRPRAGGPSLVVHTRPLRLDIR